ncbi:glycosyltransferase family 39 protein [Streptomyces sp. NPDC019396]|uniref:ArnT family glycosyltransferase n=1 Tax=Streptomyces sp. NPDC019396 TaxID=3154687 RepID=UPI0033DEC47D
MTTAPSDRIETGPPPHRADDPAAPQARHAWGGARLARLWRGRPGDPRWTRPALIGLLLATGLLYLWNLSASGWANSYYTAAAQAGSVSWKAFLFGSLDGASSITVDKPPASLWPMDLSVWIFGLNSWSVLVPEVIMGVLTVAVVYTAVRRQSGPGAGLLAGAVLALTPVAALMFRYNNPDALLALLLALSVYFVQRALEGGRTKWLVWAGVAIGFAFLTKQLQAVLVLPPLALVYAVCAPVKPLRRLWQLLAAGLAMVVAGGWWVALVELWPESSRPYIGGSTDNSFLELTFGYNGLSRVSGNSGSGTGGGPGGGGGSGFGSTGETGIDRLFNDGLGGQISWLLPAALILLVAGLVLTRRAGRADATRAAFLVWGGALLTSAVVFSYASGVFHEYYTVALAPYLAVLIGMGVAILWRERAGTRWAVPVLGATVAVTAVWGYVLLGRTSDYGPLKWLVLAAGLAAAAGLVFIAKLGRRAVLGVAGLALAASLAGPFAYTLTTLNSVHTGGMPTAGPASTSMFGGGRGGMGQPPSGVGQEQNPGMGQNMGQGQGMPGGGMPGDGGTGQQAPGGMGQPPSGIEPPSGMQPPSGGGQGQDQGQGQNQGQGQGRPGGGMGGPGGESQSVGTEVRELLLKDASKYTWVAAGLGSHVTGSYQIATEKPVMAIGGFNGNDPSPTLAGFKSLVDEGAVHYFIAGGSQGPGGGSGDSAGSQISTWVQANFKRVTVGNTTLYDLTQRTTS